MLGGVEDERKQYVLECRCNDSRSGLLEHLNNNFVSLLGQAGHAKDAFAFRLYEIRFAKYAAKSACRAETFFCGPRIDRMGSAALVG